MNLTAVLFDVDGVLIDSTAAHRRDADELRHADAVASASAELEPRLPLPRRDSGGTAPGRRQR
ncbi:hypothetical protein [Streptomyces sp. NPDC014894]|uniref:hypothetical protein n=1 Tax=Streptomyces sp. NPDC014894 TaxID=3364931 RepID=UPI0036FC8CD6